MKAIAPNLCDICHGNLRTGKSFFDGKTTGGPWAWMCSVCFDEHGIRIGFDLLLEPFPLVYRVIEL